MYLSQEQIFPNLIQMNPLLDNWIFGACFVRSNAWEISFADYVGDLRSTRLNLVVG